MKKLSIAALLWVLLSSYALAQNYVVTVHGMVCEFCAYGVAKKLRQLSFIDTEQLDDGVRVDIEDQKVYVAIKEGAALDQAALFAAIKDGGYKPVTLWKIDAQGQLTEIKP